MEYTVQQPRKLKQFGGILFGMYFGLAVGDSISRGSIYFFPDEKEFMLWGAAFWHDHHILRVVASILGTTLGSFVTGCIAKTHGRLCGFLCALPTTLFWLAVGLMAIWIPEGFEEITFGQWVVVVVLMVSSPIIGLYSGEWGAQFRRENALLFESRRNTILGVRWFHWFWVFPVLSWSGILITYSFFQALILLFGIRLSASLYNISLALIGLLIFLSIFYLFMGLYKTYILLSSGYREGISGRKIALRICGWTLGVWAIVGVLQLVVNLVFFEG